MKVKFNVKRELKIGAALLVVLIFIGFTEKKQNDVAIRDISVRIENKANNHFLDESDVLSIMNVRGQNLRGMRISDVNLKAVEKKIMKDPFIKDAELYTDIKGNLVAKVELRRPIARIVRNDGPDGYIAEDGTLMPVSDRYTARVLLISGPYMKTILKHTNVSQFKEGQQLLNLIRTIRDDEFWAAQIAQMDINAKGKITMLTQVGDERIEFGTPDNEELKLRKLNIFYKDILPKTGWNKYKRVNLEYEGQIIAE